MTTLRRSAALTCAGALLAGGGALALAPTAGAQLPPDVRTTPAWDVEMSYPMGGEHTVRFGVLSYCPYSVEGGEPTTRFSANAYDVDSFPVGFDFSAAMFPFNSATISWENLATGKRGSETVQSTGREVGIMPIPAGGVGDVIVTVTVTRSALPTVAPGSAMPFLSDTHTERFLVVPPTDCSVG